MRTKNDFSIQIDAIDEDRLMEGLQKVANRIAVGNEMSRAGRAMLMGPSFTGSR